jgi:hypothetical protein
MDSFTSQEMETIDFINSLMSSQLSANLLKKSSLVIVEANCSSVKRRDEFMDLNNTGRFVMK